jgi:hypothetical protein
VEPGRSRRGEQVPKERFNDSQNTIESLPAILQEIKETILVIFYQITRIVANHPPWLELS